MVTSCGVVGCAKNRSNAPKDGFFRLPSIVNTDETSQKLSRQRRDIWLSRINRKDLPPSQLAEKNSTLHVRGSLFILGRPVALFEPSNPYWAPSLNLGYTKLSAISSPESVCERNAMRKRRNENKTGQDEKHKGNKKILHEIINQIEIIDNSVTADRNNKRKETQTKSSANSANIERENQELKTLNQKSHNENQYLKEEIKSLKRELNNFKYDEAKFSNGEHNRVWYYTGSACFNTLIALFNLVKSEIKSGNKLQYFEKFILCLMRLRLGVSVIDLADRFQISETTAADTFLEILNISFIKLTPLVIWPERPELQMSMPMSFRSKFGCKITAMIDCFEVFIDRPSNLSARALTWSTYKSHNTAKFLIGITPQGTICFISKGWGGRTSDQFITENSNFLTGMLFWPIEDSI